MIMILDVDVTAERRHYNTHCPQGNPQPSARRAVKLKNPWAEGPSILRTLFIQPFYTTCLRQQATTHGEAVPLCALRAHLFHVKQWR